MTDFGQSRERAERLVTLASILRQGRPVTLQELRDRYRMYGEASDESARRAFERDKAELRAYGVEIATLTVDDTPGYWVNRSSATTTQLRWTEEELDTLAVLIAAISDDATGVALAKLSAASGQFPADDTTARITADLAVPPEIVEAMTQSRQLHLRYRNAEGEVSERIVEPWDLRARNGLLYLTAYDHKSGEPNRNFRIDRIDDSSLRLGDDATQPRPEGQLAPVYPDERHTFEVTAPLDLRHDVVVADGRVVGEDNGRLQVVFDDARAEPVLAWALRHGAEVVDPQEFADELERRRLRLLQTHQGAPTSVQRPRVSPARTSRLPPVRLQRLLALPTWLGERPGVTREEVAAAFGCTVSEIDAELELLDLVDVPGIGSIGEVEDVGGQLVYRRFVQEPVVELTATDALRLLLLVETGSAVLGEDEAPALTSIAARLRDAVPASAHIELAGLQHPDLPVLREAIRSQQIVTFQYKGRKDPSWRDRQVLPAQLNVSNGAVYLSGTDVVAGEERNFRLDRLSNVEVAGALTSVAADATIPAYVPTEAEVEVLLRLSPKATWLVTQITPIATAPTDEGGAIVVVRTDAIDWLLSHVRAAGGEAEIVAPPELRERLCRQLTDDPATA